MFTLLNTDLDLNIKCWTYRVKPATKRCNSKVLQVRGVLRDRKRDTHIVPLILFPRSNCTESAAQCKKKRYRFKIKIRREKGSGDDPLQYLDSAPLTHPDGSGSDHISVQTEMRGGAEERGVGGWGWTLDLVTVGSTLNFYKSRFAST